MTNPNSYTFDPSPLRLFYVNAINMLRLLYTCMIFKSCKPNTYEITLKNSI
jgi:hypothetical protein